MDTGAVGTQTGSLPDRVKHTLFSTECLNRRTLAGFLIKNSASNPLSTEQRSSCKPQGPDRRGSAHGLGQVTLAGTGSSWGGADSLGVTEQLQAAPLDKCVCVCGGGLTNQGSSITEGLLINLAEAARAACQYMIKRPQDPSPAVGVTEVVLRAMLIQPHTLAALPAASNQQMVNAIDLPTQDSLDAGLS